MRKTGTHSCGGSVTRPSVATEVTYGQVAAGTKNRSIMGWIVVGILGVLLVGAAALMLFWAIN